MDLLHADRATVDLALRPDGSQTRHVTVPPGKNVIFTVVHTGRTTGHFGLKIYAQGQLAIPVSDDGMTCVEPECQFSVEVASADAQRTFIATCASSFATSVRLEVALTPPRAEVPSDIAATPTK